MGACNCNCNKDQADSEIVTEDVRHSSDFVPDLVSLPFLLKEHSKKKRKQNNSNSGSIQRVYYEKISIWELCKNTFADYQTYTSNNKYTYGKASPSKTNDRSSLLDSPNMRGIAQSDSEDEDTDRPLEDRPVFTFKNGAEYTGQWKGDQRSGFGIQVWPDGAKYEGQWKANKAHGKGIFWHVDGDVFEGEWKRDKANGYGVYQHANGAKYEGYWKDDI